MVLNLGVKLTLDAQANVSLQRRQEGHLREKAGERERERKKEKERERMSTSCISE